MTDFVLGRFDADMLRDWFSDAGIFTVLAAKGYGDFDLRIETAGRALPHVVLGGCKAGERFLLLDGCVGEATVRPDFFARQGFAIDRPIELAVVHWMREQDPTARFSAARPALPLQDHPGLGILRRAFRVVVRIAAELGKDGVVSVPKFFHDAVIFYRSRFFLFLDPVEQGRFEALMRDLESLQIGDASMALIRGRVLDAEGARIDWTPGYQVFPLSAKLTDYFHSPAYAERVETELGRRQYYINPA
ncbi:MAG: hypothetical protein HY270_12870 [Deltaproteobacteria bacterium]|nr:hypothetical protein [Deltaproteobacteria bacterium]